MDLAFGSVPPSIMFWDKDDKDVSVLIFLLADSTKLFALLPEPLVFDDNVADDSSNGLLLKLKRSRVD